MSVETPSWPGFVYSVSSLSFVHCVAVLQLASFLEPFFESVLYTGDILVPPRIFNTHLSLAML